MFGPLLFEQLGLTPDPAMPLVMSSGGWDVLSVERLSTLRAEHIFMVIDADSEAYLKGVADTPIWQDIPAARHDHVHRVASSTWLSGDGILGCQAIVNDVLAAIVPSGVMMHLNETSRRTSASSLAGPAVVAAVMGLLLLGIAASLLVGDIPIDATTVFNAIVHHDSQQSHHIIVRDWRLPRAVADVLVGPRWRWPGPSCRPSLAIPWPVPALWG